MQFTPSEKLDKIFKEETNVIMEGDFVLVQKKSDVENDKVTSDDLSDTMLSGPVALHIVPKTIHRLRALTDMLFFEVSTPFLDDVIRLQDDAQRANGRIETEHQ
jgi:mannose-6-phosphate isomerase